MNMPTSIQGAIDLNRERHELESKITARWSWLDAHPDHPQFVERENAVLADIELQKQMTDALDAAKVALFPIASDRTTEQMEIFA